MVVSKRKQHIAPIDAGQETQPKKKKKKKKRRREGTQARQSVRRRR